MTRYGGLGRTRPKKLTSKASIPIVREQDIDIVDDEIQSALQQIETGVEKAEESVSACPMGQLIFSPVHAHGHVTASPNGHEIFTMADHETRHHRSFTCKRPSMLPRKVKIKRRIFPPEKSFSATFNMSNCTPQSSRNLRPTSASPPRSRIVADVRTT